MIKRKIGSGNCTIYLYDDNIGDEVEIRKALLEISHIYSVYFSQNPELMNDKEGNEND